MAPWQIETMADAGGTPIFSRETGDGPPILLLHGFPQTGHCWRRVAERLRGSYRVLAPDIPGYGRSGAPPSFDAVTLGATMADFMAARDAIGATVVGHDWGGAIALRLASAHRDAVSRLVIVNSPYRRLDLRRSWYMIAFMLPLLPELSLTLSRGRLVDVMLRAGAADPAAVADAVDEYRAAFRPWERRRNAFGYYRAMSRTVLTRALLRKRPSGDGRITLPTLIVWGERDPALPVALAEGIARDIQHSRLEILPDVGHFVPEEAPDALAELIAGFA